MTGDVGTTAQAWAALHLAPGEENRRAAKDAENYVRSHGGLEAVLAGLETGDRDRNFRHRQAR